MLPGNAWLDLLRKSAQHPLVIAAMADLGSPRIDSRDRGCEYRSWRDKGVSLYFERDRLSRLNFYSSRLWEQMSGFSGPLPYGISLHWTRTELHRQLGNPVKSNEVGCTYEFCEDMVRLMVVFGMQGGEEIEQLIFMPLQEPIVIY